MARMTRPCLTSAIALPNFKMQLTFRDGSCYTVNFEPFFAENKGLSPLRDPELFAKVVSDPDGWVIEWLELDIQIGADTLWLDAQAQSATEENTRILASFI